MTSAAPPKRVSQVDTALAGDRLGAAAIVFFNLSAAAPLMVVAGVIPTGFATTGITGLPSAFYLIAAMLSIFAVGFVAMARRVTNTGAFYAYVTRGLGRPAGVAAAWVALAAYNCLQAGLYGIIGAATGPLVHQWLGLTLPWWLIALAAWALVGGLGVLRVDVNARVLAMLMLAEVGVIIVFDAVNLTHPAGGTVTLTTLSPANLTGSGLGALLVLAVLGFIGFENAVVYAEESRQRDRSVPIATFSSIVIIGTLYALSSWAMTVATGTSQIVARAADSGPELLFTLAAAHLGSAAGTIGHTFFATSIIAAAISFHNTTARYVFALGREDVLPAIFGSTNRFGAPKAGSILQTAIGLVVIVAYAIGGWDPVTRLFYWSGTVGGLGVLLLLTATSLAIVGFFARYRGGESLWQSRIAPCIAVLGMTSVLALAMANFSTVLGPAPGWLPRAIPAAYAAIAVCGAGYALVLKAQRSPVYPRIGMGARSAILATSAATSAVTTNGTATNAAASGQVQS